MVCHLCSRMAAGPPLSLSQRAPGVVWRWAGALTGLGMFTCVWEEWQGSDPVWDITVQRAAGQEGAYACSVRYVTILTPCAGAESGLRGEAVAQQTDLCPIFKLLKWCVIAETKHDSGERSLLLYGSSLVRYILCFFCLCNNSSGEQWEVWPSNWIDCE